MTDTPAKRGRKPRKPATPESELESFDTAPPTPTATATDETAKPIVRRFKRNTAFFSDLFKLSVAKMLQYKGWQKITKNSPRDRNNNLNDDWFETEHCHYFRTYDSNGKEQTLCQPVGQHYHRIEVIRDPKDPTQIIGAKCVSGPLKYQIVEEYGKREKMLVEDPHDNHTHDVVYLKSDELHRPDMNSEAAIVVSRAMAAQTSREVYDEEGKRIGKLEVR